MSWFTEVIVRKTVVLVSWSAQQYIDNFPPPLLLNTPLDNGLVARKTGCPLSATVIIIFFCHFCPIHLVDYLHCTTFSPIQVRGMTIVLLRIFFPNRETNWAFDSHSFLFVSWRCIARSNSSLVLTLLWLFLHLILFLFFSTSLQNNLQTWNGSYWTNTKDDSIRRVWNFPWLACLRVGFWCQCIWFGSWSPD